MCITIVFLACCSPLVLMLEWSQFQPFPYPSRMLHHSSDLLSLYLYMFFWFFYLQSVKIRWVRFSHVTLSEALFKFVALAKGRPCWVAQLPWMDSSLLASTALRHRKPGGRCWRPFPVITPFPSASSPTMELFRGDLHCVRIIWLESLWCLTQFC